ncbi:MAG: DUF3618 domain-containing protein [Planctomycetaceae bacterium]
MAVTQSNGLNRGDGLVADIHEPTDSDEIRRDIDRTRTEMDRTIDELGERLQPRNLFDEVIASVRGSLFSTSGTSCRTSSAGGSQQLSEQLSDTASRMGRSLIETVRENPVPAALMGAGLAWLLFEDKAERAYRSRRLSSNADAVDELEAYSGSYVDARTGKPYDESYGAGFEDLDDDGEPDVEPESLKDKAARAASSVKQAVQGTASALGSAAGTIGHAAGKTAQSVKGAARRTGRTASSTKHALGDYGHSMGRSMRQTRESAREYRHSTADSVQRFGHLAADKTRAGYAMSRDRFNDALDDKPMAVGVAAIAAGLLAGFALPRTRAEDRTIGHTADEFKDEARRRGREAVEQGRDVASHLAEEALGDAEGQGLSPDSLGGKVARVAKDAMHAAKDSARREGIDAGSLAEKAKHVGESVKQKGKDEMGARTGKADGRPASVDSGSSTLPATGAMGTTVTGTSDSDKGRTC